MNVLTVIITVLTALLFLAAARVKFIAEEHAMQTRDRLGISPGRYRFIGVLEVAGALSALVGLAVWPLGISALAGWSSSRSARARRRSGCTARRPRHEPPSWPSCSRPARSSFRPSPPNATGISEGSQAAAPPPGNAFVPHSRTEIDVISMPTPYELARRAMQTPR